MERKKVKKIFLIISAILLVLSIVCIRTGIDKKENYTIDISKGIGTITLDGEKVEDNKKYENGDNFLEINGGIGNINIEFEK